MADFTLRETQPEDYAALSALWQRCFGDPPELIGKLFALLPELGRGVTAVCQGSVVGAAYALTGLELLPDRTSCGYIYAVAVDENCRGLGIGGALSAAAAEAARQTGVEMICTLPAEESLYDWYERLIGVKYPLRRRTLRCMAATGECREISAGEYSARREKLLCGRAHIRFPAAYLSFQRELCKCYGGGFFAVGDGIAAAYPEGDTAKICELILPAGAERNAAAAAIAAKLGAAFALSYGPAADGERFVVCDSPLPWDCEWNLALD